MATIEKMTIEYNPLQGRKYVSVDRCFNVSEPVGIGQPNKIGDVMVVQALLFLAAQGHYAPLLPNGGEDLPLVTGMFNNKTMRTIWEFQQHSASKALSADGIVHPASFKGRKLRGVGAPMTITQLNLYAWAINATKNYGWDHTKAILDMFPMLRILVSDLTV